MTFPADPQMGHNPRGIGSSIKSIQNLNCLVGKVNMLGFREPRYAGNTKLTPDAADRILRLGGAEEHVTANLRTHTATGHIRR